MNALSILGVAAVLGFGTACAIAANARIGWFFMSDFVAGSVFLTGVFAVILKALS